MIDQNSLRQELMSIAAPYQRSWATVLLDTNLQKTTEHYIVPFMNAAMRSAPLLGDLRMQVVENCTSDPFIFSDSPVVFHNSLYCNTAVKARVQPTARGLQIFYPLSPRLLLMLFDAHVYATRSASTVIKVDSPEVVTELNALQVVNADRLVFFASAANTDYVRAIYKQYSPLRADMNWKVKQDDRGFAYFDQALGFDRKLMLFHHKTVIRQSNLDPLCPTRPQSRRAARHLKNWVEKERSELISRRT